MQRIVRKTTVLFFILLALSPIWVESSPLSVDYEVDWQRAKFRIAISYDLKQSGLSMPGARNRAEESIRTNFSSLVEGPIQALRLDSSQTIADYLASGRISGQELAIFIKSAQSLGAYIDTQSGKLISRFNLELPEALPFLVRHQESARPPRPLRAASTRAYTGIVIFADEPLPLHGTRREALAVPAFFPKIHDEHMQVIYERHIVRPEIARKTGIVKYSTRAHISDWEDIVGEDPMVILARGLFGIDATDPIICEDDALRIVSNNENRALLEAGRIVIVVHPSVLIESP